MSENISSLEKTLHDSIGGFCYFPETLNLPVNPDQMSVRKRIRGKLGETRRFKKLIDNLFKSGKLNENELKEEWAKVK